MQGDRNGIGPEVVAKLLADDASATLARIVLVGDPRVAAAGRRAAGVGDPQMDLRVIKRKPPGALPIGTGQVSAAAGAEVLDHLRFLLELYGQGEIEGIVYAPLNKQSMRLGGLSGGDELDFVTQTLGFSGNCGELNLLDGLWTSRVTAHVPLSDVVSLVTLERVLDATTLMYDTLVAAGVERPRIAVAGLNPHAGDGGAFGDDERRVIEPAIAQARARGIDATGPFPPDTVFVTARDGRYDAVVTMYHDQGQIAMKLMGFGRGVMVLGGIPVPVATVGHGTAFDIVGKGVARADGLREAVSVCARMVLSRRLARRPAGGVF
jgi:4-hydroxythreonine-4-phosphate dehydrogenase